MIDCDGVNTLAQLNQLGCYLMLEIVIFHKLIMVMFEANLPSKGLIIIKHEHGDGK